MTPLLWPLLTLLGCPKPAIPLGQTVIEDIRFEGNSKRIFAPDGPAALKDAIETQESTRFIDLPGRLDVGPFLGELSTADAAVLDDDKERIETWYAHHGWFDAKFLGWDLVPRKRWDPLPKKPPVERPPTADLVGRIEPGERSVLDAAPELLGLADLGGPIRASLQKLVLLDAGDPFDLDDYSSAMDDIRARLQERGYAYATVTGHVTVHPDKHLVHVVYTVTPGRVCVFGEIKVVGEKVTTERVLEELDFATGDGFRTSKLAAARQRLYGLGVYSVVEVVPTLTTPEERRVPITVRLSRRKSRVLQVGPTLSVESNQQQLSVVASYSDDDAFKKLWRWTADAELGVATTADFSQLEAVPLDEQLASSITPTGGLTQAFTIPNVIGKKLSFIAATDIHHAVDPGYRLLQASVAPSLSYAHDRFLTTSLGYRLQYSRYYDYADLRAIRTTNLSVEVREQSVLSIVQEKLTWDLRDDKLAPTRNSYVSIGLDEAGGPFGGDEGFFRATADLRAYKGFRLGRTDVPHTVLAARLGGGSIVLYDPDSGVDIAERLRLGGGTTVRGWAEDRLGPHLCYDPATDQADVAADGTAQCLSSDIIEGVGGMLSVYGNFEVRQDLPWHFGGVLFVDAGRVWDKVENASFDGIQWSVGGGIRYHSPIGPIRLDFGWVPAPDPYFAAEPGWQVHLGIGEAF